MRRLLAQFNLLPVPPRRSQEAAEATLLRGMAGRGGQSEVRGEEEGKEGRQVRASWLYRSAHTVTQPQLSADGQTTAVGESVQEGKSEALKKFPFTFVPTSSTLTAWQLTRQRWNNSAKQATTAHTTTDAAGSSAT